ncbi:3-hydroxyacyl-CoA dehydrogenase NAD-binding domain-containing protein [Streptomyces sp. NPDC014846]|uniref:3-hydroxyacyl-CoA dehydrogenase NAD-binding domain-containing protein n=1 Tax=unclassified Streptomyces TaxID=2593676 RepID=UPI0036FCF029
MSGGVRRVGVAGGGQVGAGLAEVCARTGLDTVLCEVDAVAARAARDRMAASPGRRHKPERGIATCGTPRPGPG